MCTSALNSRRRFVASRNAPLVISSTKETTTLNVSDATESEWSAFSLKILEAEI